MTRSACSAQIGSSFCAAFFAQFEFSQVYKKLDFLRGKLAKLLQFLVIKMSTLDFLVLNPKNFWFGPIFWSIQTGKHLRVCVCCHMLGRGCL